jgi:hypothetical protein
MKWIHISIGAILACLIPKLEKTWLLRSLLLLFIDCYGCEQAYLFECWTSNYKLFFLAVLSVHDLLQFGIRLLNIRLQRLKMSKIKQPLEGFNF